MLALPALLLAALAPRLAIAAPALLSPSDFATTLGSSVAVSGTTIVVGAPPNATLGADAGAAYVFVQSGTSWVWQAKLLAQDAAAGDRFGASVAIDGDTAVVGAPKRADLGPSAGVAYVFVRSGSTWSQQQKIVPADGASNRQFGWSIALSGATLLVGAPYDGDLGTAAGAAYAFVRSGSTWSQQRKLLASDGAASAYLGYSVSIDGDTALAGAFGVSDSGPSSGAAYAFVRSGSTWSQQQKLRASDGVAGDEFGWSVSVSGSSAVMGAPFRSDDGSGSGAAYSFSRTGTVWSQQRKILPTDGAANDNFGIAVSLYGTTLIVGSYLDDDLGTNSGSAYLFTGASWTQTQKLTAATGPNAWFGWSVAAGATNLAIGAPGIGAAYAAPAPFIPVPALPGWTGALLLAVALVAGGSKLTRLRS